MKVYRITHVVKREYRPNIELTCDIPAIDKKSAIEKAYRTLPESVQKKVIMFEHKTIDKI